MSFEGKEKEMRRKLSFVFVGLRGYWAPPLGAALILSSIVGYSLGYMRAGLPLWSLPFAFLAVCGAAAQFGAKHGR